jgi:MFS family permease
MRPPENKLRVGIPSPGPSFRAALRNRDFALLWGGQLGSEIGNGLIQLALPWLVLQLTGSAFQLGLAYFIQFLPILLFGILGGVFVDRWDRRLTMVIVDAVRAIGFISIGVIYYLGYLTVEYLFLIIFLEATLANLFNPARVALLPNLVDPENLRPANSLMEVSRHVGFLIAPPVGGVLVAILGPAAIMLVNGVTFLASGVAVFLIRWRQPPREVVLTDGFLHSTSLVLEQTREGLRKIVSSRMLQVTVLLGFGLNLIVAPIQVLLPLFVVHVKGEGPTYFGVMVGGLLLGLILGSLSAPTSARRVGLGRLAIGAVVLLGATIMVASWPPGLIAPVLAMIIAGAAIGTLNVAQITMLQGATTDDERGRVSATYYTCTLGVRPPGFLVIGALADSVDIRWLFVALGFGAFLLGAVVGQSREVRETR